MRIAFTWDDGAPEDRHLFELHERYEIPGMFFVPTQNLLKGGRTVIPPETMRSAESQYVVFGGHTQSHHFLTEIPFEQVDGEIRENQIYLEDTLGHAIEHFCLPGGFYNQQILEVAQRYYRTIRLADNMYFQHDSGPLVHTTFHFYPRGIKSLLWHGITAGSWPQLVNVVMYNRMDYFDLVERIIEREREKDDSAIVIWGHSWEIDQLALWDRLEQLMQSAVVQSCKCSYQELAGIG